MFEKTEIEIPCPGCGRKTKKKVAWLKTHDHFDCPGCRETVRVDAKKLLAGFKRAEEAVAKLGKSLRKR